MSEKQSRSKKSAFRISLSTLLWFFVSCSCFFAGRYSNQPELPLPSPANQLTVSLFDSKLVSMQTAIPEILIENPAVCSVTPISQGTIRIDALGYGTTTITFLDYNRNKTEYSIVVPDNGID